VIVYFRGEQIGEGHGSSIQQGEKYAARKALEKYYFPQREWQQYYIRHRIEKNEKKGKNQIKRENNSDHPTGPGFGQSHIGSATSKSIVWNPKGHG